MTEIHCNPQWFSKLEKYEAFHWKDRLVGNCISATMVPVKGFVLIVPEVGSKSGLSEEKSDD